MEKIYSALAVEKVATMLLLDVTGAFDNVSHSQFFHNLKNHCIGEFTLTWIASFLSDCYTTLKLVNNTTGKIKTVIELPLGLLLTSILYLFYNVDLIGVFTNPDNRTAALGFIDNEAILAIERSAEGNLETLLEVHGKAIDLPNTSRLVFAKSKY